MIKNTVDSYGLISKVLHWVMAVLIIGMLICGFVMENLEIKSVFYIHKTIGFLILILAIIRLLWKVSNIVPRYPETMPKIMLMGANAMHYTLYILMILMPLSAFMASNYAGKPVSFLFIADMPLLFEYKNLELAKKLIEIHSLLAIILIITVAFHVVAAIMHHFVLKDNILKRMLP